MPASFSGAVNIHDGIIDGHTSTGIQAGEPGQTNLGPATTVTNVTIAGAQQNNLHGDIANETQAVMTFNGTAAGENVSSSLSSTGRIVFHGNGGNDTFTGHNEIDTATYAATLAISDITYDVGAHQWVVNAGAEGTDRLSGVEKITDGGGHTYILAGNGYATLQAAINASSTGNTILVAGGTLADTGSVEVNKAVTIAGFYHDVDGNSGTRLAGSESVLNGGLYISVDGVKIDGLKIVGGAVNAGNSNAIYVDHDNVTITHSIIEAGATPADYGIVTPFGGNVSGLSIDGNLVNGWDVGGYFNPSTQFTMIHNTFTNFGNAFDGDDWAPGTFIDGNHFAATAFSTVGYGVFDNAENVQQYFGTNTYESPGRKIGIFLYGDGTGDGDGQTVTGTDQGDYITSDNAHIANSGTSDTLIGGGGDDKLEGADGNDVLIGGTGTDLLDGGTGIDTAVYAAALAITDISFSAGKWTVNASVSEGTETLTNIEIVDGGGAGGARFLLVGGDGFATIQAAVDAAADGDTILISAGSHAENVTVTNKALTFVGANHDIGGADSRGTESSILGRVSVTGSKAVEFNGIEFRADGTTGTTGFGNAALELQGAGNYTVHNSVFFANFVGGNSNAIGIELDTTATGATRIELELVHGPCLDRNLQRCRLATRDLVGRRELRLRRHQQYVCACPQRPQPR